MRFGNPALDSNSLQQAWSGGRIAQAELARKLCYTLFVQL
jgi:hypothetical protein